MNDDGLKRIIMENLPGVERGEASLIYLRIAVTQDLKSLGEEFSEVQFQKCLRELHDTQRLFLFSNGWVKATKSGLVAFGIQNY